MYLQIDAFGAKNIHLSKNSHWLLQFGVQYSFKNTQTNFSLMHMKYNDNERFQAEVEY